MSTSPIARSSDLAKLANEGYDIRVVGSVLLVANVPYVNSSCGIERGVLVSTLNLAGDVTMAPDTHVMYFAGQFPCDAHGVELDAIRHASADQVLGGVTVNHSFSSKPPQGYPDYYEKVVAYCRILENQARAIDPNVSARVFAIIEQEADESVFVYPDTATTRAGIHNAAAKLQGQRLAIVGVGGTGSHILDLVAKSPAAEIHVFDGDRLLSHNAFRAPGAAAIEELRGAPQKVDYFVDKYSRMRRGVIAHPYYLNEQNASELAGFDFVFLAMDEADEKADVVAYLLREGIPLVDSGMGLSLTETNSIRGQVRLTTATAAKSDHLTARMPSPVADLDDAYSTNIQVVELNSLAAALAVIRWKKLFAFYEDLEKEHHSVYVIDGNTVINDDQGPL